MPYLRTPDTKKSLGVEKSSYDVVCAAKSSISTCFRCAKKLCLIGRTILPIAQSIEATIVDWDGYIYIYIYIYIYRYIYIYIHTYIQTYIQTHCEITHRDYLPRLTARQLVRANHNTNIILDIVHTYLWTSVLYLRMYAGMYTCVDYITFEEDLCVCV